MIVNQLALALCPMQVAFSKLDECFHFRTELLHFAFCSGVSIVWATFIHLYELIDWPSNSTWMASAFWRCALISSSCLNFTFLHFVLLQLLFLFVIPASLYVKVLSFITALQDDSSCEHKDQLWLCMSCHHADEVGRGKQYVRTTTRHQAKALSVTIPTYGIEQQTFVG